MVKSVLDSLLSNFSEDTNDIRLSVAMLLHVFSNSLVLFVHFLNVMKGLPGLLWIFMIAQSLKQ